MHTLPMHQQASCGVIPGRHLSMIGIPMYFPSHPQNAHPPPIHGFTSYAFMHRKGFLSPLRSLQCIMYVYIYLHMG